MRDEALDGHERHRPAERSAHRPHLEELLGEPIPDEAAACHHQVDGPKATEGKGPQTATDGCPH